MIVNKWTEIIKKKKKIGNIDDRIGGLEGERGLEVWGGVPCAVVVAAKCM